MYNLALLYIFGGLGTLLLGIYFFRKVREEEQLHKLLTRPFPQEYKQYLSHIPHYVNMPQEQKEKIERSMLLFIHTKEFEGAADLEVTDEIKVIIAFYACLLVFNSKLPGCYENLKNIIIYPHHVAVEHIIDNGGILSKEQMVIEGEAIGESVVLIWHDVKKDVYHPRKENVVVHEFAHEVDFMDGLPDGIPPLERSKYDEWVKLFYKDYKKTAAVMLKQRNKGRYKLLGEYAATNEAEFFAVVTERFFQTPRSFRKKFPELYDELKELYGLDPMQLVKGR